MRKTTTKQPTHITLAQCKAIVGVSRTAVEKRIAAKKLRSDEQFGKQMVLLADALAWKKEREART